MSPEQARGQKVEPSSDIFSFGIALYELLTGEHPFKAGTPIDTLHRIINDEPVSTRARCPELPDAMHSIVERCLKKDKNQRFQSASDLEAHLRSAQGAPPSPKRPARRRGLLAAAIVFSICLAIGLWFWNPFVKPAGNTVTVHSVAVLNLTTLPEDPIAGVIAQGLSEELGGALSREGFLVPARSRVLALSGNGDAQTIGTQLNVDAVLEGNVTNVSDTYRVYIELVDSKTGFQIWSRLSTTTQADVLSTDSNTADEIARQVHSAVGGR
jgi:TolB-like protein